MFQDKRNQRVFSALIVALVWLSISGSARTQGTDSPAPAPAFVTHKPGRTDVELTIRPGTTTRAEVELGLGDAIRRLSSVLELYEYGPSPGAAAEGVARIVIEYFSDLKTVARIDVYLSTPIPAESLSGLDYGTRVVQRDRPDGGREDLYYPSFQAVVFLSNAPRAPAAAIGFLSPRALSDIYAKRAEEQLRAGRRIEAANDADKAVLTDPASANGYLAQGRCLVAENNVDEALLRFERAVSAMYGPRARADAHLELAIAYWKSKRLPERAEDHFLRAIAIAPGLDSVPYRYGLFLKEQKRTEQAETQFRRAIELNANDIDARMELAASLFDRNERRQALPEYRLLSAWAETGAASGYDGQVLARIHIRYGYILGGDEGKHDEAIAVYELAAKRDPRSAVPFNNMGHQYQLLQQLDLAEACYRKALEIDPTYGTANRNLAGVLIDLRRFEQARAQAELALSLRPEAAELMYDLARCWGGLGKRSQALDWVRKAIAAGFRDRKALTSDPRLAALQKDAEFKKLLEQVR